MLYRLNLSVSLSLSLTHTLKCFSFNSYPKASEIYATAPIMLVGQHKFQNLFMLFQFQAPDSKDYVE